MGSHYLFFIKEIVLPKMPKPFLTFCLLWRHKKIYILKKKIVILPLYEKKIFILPLYGPKKGKTSHTS